MVIKSFEDIVSWQKSKVFVVDIYKAFKNCRDFGFKDQICRASISIMNNIAEGFERSGNKEFRNFLFISKGSCGEVRSMLYAAFDLKYISEDEYKNLYENSIVISKLISGLIKTL
ncbi:MAG TPA: four helix bundle protein [Patescibacteria group bacterium]|nr:four helix bundle protein [Patescibacteria group bacterium]